MASGLSFVEVSTDTHIARVESLAEIIWPEHYTPIIGAAQVGYMLEKFQSAGAIRAQVDAGVRYYLIKIDGVSQGYLSYLIDGDEMFLSKIYLHADVRGRGYARRCIDFLDGQCRSAGAVRIGLTVNKYNRNTIEIYQALGFKIVDDMVKDIGGGFVMDDYQMERPVPPI